MSKSANQKQKLLLIADYFKKNTDETHLVTTPQIISYLAANDIQAERKSIYDDLETLKSYGLDIEREGGPKGGYHLMSRDFELAEVKLLVDVVQASKFITHKKSRQLIDKLEELVSKYDASKLQRQVVMSDRNKTTNEKIYYSVDQIYQAISENVKISFQYFEWDVDKKQKLRKDGAFYLVSPWLLIWEDENYYLVAYDNSSAMIRYYRVDKMLNLSLTNQAREGKEDFDKIDVAAFSKKTFSMFAGEEKTVRLVADNRFTSVIVDRFGQSVALRKYDQDHVIARCQVAVSPQFYGWLCGLGAGIRIEGPDEVAEGYKAYLQQIIDKYN